jgi:hypothetical protein
VTQAVLTLAVTAPGGPPGNGGEFLDRLDPAWLAAAYAGDPGPLAAVRAARGQLPDISLRYRTLLSRLGPALDGPGELAGADAWYFILEGTREQSVAEAQAMALTELAAALATSPGTEPRAILLACDDYSAVSGRVPLWQLYERGRSLGIGVQVSAQIPAIIARLDPRTAIREGERARVHVDLDSLHFFDPDSGDSLRD